MRWLSGACARVAREATCRDNGDDDHAARALAMSDSTLFYLTPEAQARVRIDEMLGAAGWVVHDARQVNLTAARGVAVREFVLPPPHGRTSGATVLAKFDAVTRARHGQGTGRPAGRYP